VIETPYVVDAYVSKNVLPDNGANEIDVVGVFQFIISSTGVGYIVVVVFEIALNDILHDATPPDMLLLIGRIRADALVENNCVQLTPPAGGFDGGATVKLASNPNIPDITEVLATELIYSVV
jgi:hypothetical protein